MGRPTVDHCSCAEGSVSARTKSIPPRWLLTDKLGSSRVSRASLCSGSFASGKRAESSFPTQTSLVRRTLPARRYVRRFRWKPASLGFPSGKQDYLQILRAQKAEASGDASLGILLALGDDIQKVTGGEKLVHELVVVDQGEHSLVLVGQQALFDMQVTRSCDDHDVLVVG